MLRALMKKTRQTEWGWRYLWNFGPAVSYRLASREPLPAEARRVVADLRESGVAVTSVDALFPQPASYTALQTAVERLEREQAAEIEAARLAVQSPGGAGKSYLVELLGSRPQMQMESDFLRFGLQPPVLEIANMYFGMYTRLRQWNVWHNVATQAPARASQLWHRDHDDLHKILKLFVYLSDVDDGAGPFTYARGSHRIRREPECLYREGATGRSDDAQMARLVPESDWIRCTGRAGTVVFADTHGYHKGGLARTHDRVMYVCMFTSALAHNVDLFVRPAEASAPPDLALALRPEARHALACSAADARVRKQRSAHAAGAA